MSNDESRALEQLVADVRRAFTEIHERVFRGDPAANPRLDVEVVGAATALDTPVIVLLTPWTCNGLAFPPDGAFPAQVDVAERSLTARRTSIEQLGPFWSVNLIGDVSRLTSQRAALAAAAGWVAPWQHAATSARRGSSPSGDH